MFSGRRVLLVDDDDGIREMLAIGLQDEGLDVRAARDGLQALALLADWHPDAIVLDLMMPTMDGWTFRDEQRRHGLAPGVPVVIISAARDLDRHVELLGAATGLVKPFDFAALLATLQRVLGDPESLA